MGRTGIIGAMEEEIILLKEKMEIEVVVKKASMEFYQGTLNGKEVVLVKSGIGKVNAGLCAQILVDVFNVNRLINTGIAGSLKAEISCFLRTHCSMIWTPGPLAMQGARFPGWIP